MTLPLHSHAAVASTLILAAALASVAEAGPTLACPDGPDPLRFRPSAAIPGGDCAAADPAGAGPVALAAAVDAVTGREWVAVAWRGPGDELFAAVSADGACSFGPGGGLAATLIEPGPIEGRPAVALRVDDGAVRWAVAWAAASRVQVRLSDVLDGSFAAAAVFDGAPVGGGPALAMAPAPAAPVAVLAWGDAASGSAFAATSAAGTDPASWSAAAELATGLGAGARAAVSADAAGAGGAAGLSLLALAEGGAEAWFLRSQDDGASWAAPRRVDDGTRDELRSPGVATAADPGAPDAAWTLLTWQGRELAGPRPLGVVMDAARHAAGVLDQDFDGVAGAGNVVLDPAVPPEARPVVAAAAEGLGYALWERGGEWSLARRAVAAARPALSGGCTTGAVTGTDPARSAGAASEPAAGALGRDLVAAFVDDRSGAPVVRVKRSDSVPPELPVLGATPTACGEAPAVAVTWGAPACDVSWQLLEVGTAPGGTDFTRDPGLDAAVVVEGLSPGTTVYFRLRVADTAGNEVLSEEVAADLPSCAEALLRTSIVSTSDDCPFGGAGGDGTLDPGETATLRLRVENQGTVAAPAVELRLFSRTPELLVRTGNLMVGDLDVGAFAEVDVALDLSATVSCGGLVEALARATSDGTRWADLLDLSPPAGCRPCASAACAVAADASATAPTVICNGDSATLDATATGVVDCAGVLLHEWWDGGTLVGTAAAETVSPGSTRTYRLVSRCSTDFDCRGESTVEIVVNSLPGVGFTEIPPPPHCEGETITLTASTGDPGASFAWDSGETTPDLAVSSGGLYRVTVTDTNGCVRARTWRVDFGPSPLADAGPAPAADSCSPVRIGTPAAPLLDYAWDPPDGLSDPLAAQPWAAPAAPTDYRVTVTDPLSGCTSVDTVRVDVRPPPPRVETLRLSRSAGLLVASWALPPDRPVRLYSESDVSLARTASAASATAALRCEGLATCGTVPGTGSLVFFQAVAACEDGSIEGPN